MKGCKPLFLGERRDPDLQANAAGAIQSICFQERGRAGAYTRSLQSPT